MVHRLFEVACVLGPVMGKDGFASVNFVQGNDVFLDHFDRHRFRGGEVPDLLAFGLCLPESTDNLGRIDIFSGLAKVKAL